MTLPPIARITEAGPRDRLQTKPRSLPTAHETAPIRRLAAQGAI